MFCLYACMCATCVSDAHRDQKRVIGPLELALQMVMNTMGTGN